jgi:hypothetical protein
MLTFPSRSPIDIALHLLRSDDFVVLSYVCTAHQGLDFSSVAARVGGDFFGGFPGTESPSMAADTVQDIG